MNSYHNTNELHGPALAKAEGNATSQQEQVLEYFRGRYRAEYGKPGPGGKRRASEVIRFFSGYIKESSVRRCMSDLVKAGKLEKLDEKELSPDNSPEHYHVYQPPAMIRALQGKLFEI